MRAATASIGGARATLRQRFASSKPRALATLLTHLATHAPRRLCCGGTVLRPRNISGVARQDVVQNPPPRPRDAIRRAAPACPRGSRRRSASSRPRAGELRVPGARSRRRVPLSAPPPPQIAPVARRGCAASRRSAVAIFTAPIILTG
jgi:hypothetical protein